MVVCHRRTRWSFRGAKRTRSLEMPRGAIAPLSAGAGAPSRNDSVWLRPRPRLHILFDSGLLFRRHRALVAIALLQPVPICPDIRPKILVEADSTGQPQGIADRDIGGGKAAGAHGLG